MNVIMFRKGFRRGRCSSTPHSAHVAVQGQLYDVTHQWRLKLQGWIRRRRQQRLRLHCRDRWVLHCLEAVPGARPITLDLAVAAELQRA